MDDILREYVIETKRYVKNGETQFDQWISNNENIRIEDNYLRHKGEG